MLIEKEVIRPGQYFYVDEATGQPRKLVVTPALIKHWHEQGSAMLSTGLTVPVPYEHDFSAHPMTPKDKLLNNAGEVRGYTVHDAKDGAKDVLFSSVDVSDPAVKDKIGKSVRWTSPWISSFTDGNGKKWDNVITHLALTTRPRITKQEPFVSIAAALSLATPIRTWDEAPKGVCISRAGLLLDDGASCQPAYPMAFSLWSGVALATDATGHEHDERGLFGSGHDATKKAHDASKTAVTMPLDKLPHSNRAMKASTEAHLHSYNGKHREAAASHRDAATHHVSAARIHSKAGRHEEAHEHANAASAHFAAATEHNMEHSRKNFDQGGGNPTFAVEPPPKKKPPVADPAAVEDDTDGAEEGLEELDDSEQDGEDGLNNPLEDGGDLGDANGDIEMEELLCDLLQALGVPMPDESNEVEFKRHLYEAVMSKIKELTSQSMAGDKKQPMTDQNNPPNQNPHTSHPSKGQNPLIQQEQQPMFMSLEEINALPDPVKGVALAFHNETTKANAKAAEAERRLNSLVASELNKANEARKQRVAMLAKLAPRVKPQLDAMLALPGMALSIGDGGAIVDPMAQTLEVLERGLADMPQLWQHEKTTLSIHPQPTDAEALSEARADELANSQAQKMGCPPLPAKAS